MLDLQLNGKVAIVTGANRPRGIGAAIAAALCTQGVRVFITSHQTPVSVGIDPAKAHQPGREMYELEGTKDGAEVVERIRAAGGQINNLLLDLSDPASVPRVFDAAKQRFGPVSILVNNAAHWDGGDTFTPQGQTQANDLVQNWGDVFDITAERHDRSFAVNARAVALMMAEFARRHVASGANWGRIINISTESFCFPGEVTYGASKHAKESYSRSAAVELAPFGISVNMVSPGPTQTGYMSPDIEAQIAASTPMRRIGWPEDIADAVLLLASEQARWITGQLIHVGGGHKL